MAFRPCDFCKTYGRVDDPAQTPIVTEMARDVPVIRRILRGDGTADYEVVYARACEEHAIRVEAQQARLCAAVLPVTGWEDLELSPEAEPVAEDAETAAVEEQHDDVSQSVEEDEEDADDAQVFSDVSQEAHVEDEQTADEDDVSPELQQELAESRGEISDDDVFAEESPNTIREWARRNGITVKPRGRIPANVTRMYREARAAARGGN